MTPRRALARLWLWWRWRGGRGCQAAEVWRLGGQAAMERLLADVDGDDDE